MSPRPLVVLVLILLGGHAAAQSPKERDAPGFRIVLAPAAGLPNGKVATLQSATKAKPDRFFVENIGVLQPVVVTLFAGNTRQPVKMFLAKDRWDQPLKALETDATGQVTAKLRTQGELRIVVPGVAGEPRPYFLMVWVGDEVKPELASVVQPMSKHAGGGGSRIGTVAAIAAVMLILGAIVMVWRRRARSSVVPAMALLFVTLAARPVLAAPPLAPRALDPTDMQQRLDEMRSAERAAGDAASAGAQSAGETGIAWATWGVGVVRSGRELLDAYEALTDADATCMDLSTAGAPAVPTSCETDGPCEACYTDAYRQLDGMRLNLERLRCYYTAGRDVADKAIAFGDTTSGVHGVAGLAWQNARAGIVKAKQKLQRTYDTKYSQMIPNLRGALDAVATCEKKFFDVGDWYDRYGFIYFTFMADRYKRND